MALSTTRLSRSHQIYLTSDVLQAVGAEAGQTFIVRVRNGVIELIPSGLAEGALDLGLQNMLRASLQSLEEEWDNPEDDAWNEA